MAWSCLVFPSPQGRMWCVNDLIGRFGPNSVHPCGRTARLCGKMSWVWPEAAASQRSLHFPSVKWGHSSSSAPTSVKSQ